MKAVVPFRNLHPQITQIFLCNRRNRWTTFYPLLTTALLRQSNLFPLTSSRQALLSDRPASAAVVARPESGALHSIRVRRDARVSSRRRSPSTTGSKLFQTAAGSA